MSDVEQTHLRIERAALGETTPVADGIGPVPHLLPEPLARRLRSEECLRGEPCEVPGCLCSCHNGTFPDARMEWVLSGLDRIINQGPGSWNGFDVGGLVPAADWKVLGYTEAGHGHVCTSVCTHTVTARDHYARWSPRVTTCQADCPECAQ